MADLLLPITGKTVLSGGFEGVVAKRRAVVQVHRLASLRRPAARCLTAYGTIPHCDPDVSATSIPAFVTVHVRLFAAARDAAGVSAYEASAGALGDILAAGPAGLAAVLPRCSYLVDGQRADLDTFVPPGATLDVLPPFAGG
jgi:molybdopterin synthase sulfur carrier subunit